MQGCDTESACGVGMLREGFCDIVSMLPDTKLYYQRAIPITNSQSAASTRLFRDVDTGRDASLRLAGYHAFAEHLVEQAKGVAREAGRVAQAGCTDAPNARGRLDATRGSR